ncbi:mechanosensitive ion channel family protein [Paenibacillus athensensis]|uniref:Mechanosensing system component YbdG n=1 Tax=Paenibacillus athensensis TaxID=1967502 RepID=A0A4Y8PUA9_9BACL|nr:mechanosensitive ion channel family protein [Paenibacillus athensensis]MCD1261711.1 mechanosensitive ion channel family protein [Paenibacillus athensensis]
MELIQNWLVGLGVQEDLALYLTNLIVIVGISVLCIAANFLTKKVVLKVLTFYIHNNRFKWDNYLLQRKVFHKLSHVVPALIIFYFSFMFPAYQSWIEKGILLYMIIVGLQVMNAFLDAVHDIYSAFEISKARPIRGYLQVMKIFIFIIGGILLISNLIGESPLILLSGIGALSAVMMLVFKDSILGLVAGVQLTSNDMVRVGDWIEMPKYGADGEIIDISLNTVKIQNWDKTITTIPTYTLISDSFKNWRGMSAAGGRRMKRSVFVDTSSIVMCSPEMLEKFKSIQYLRDYIVDREREIEQFHIENHIDRSCRVNGRAMTNIGVFRTYIQLYLEQHPKIHQGMTCMVRQLQPVDTGLPLELYAFTNDVNWAVYEGVQADIFDHLFAVAPEFGLRIFQNPTGYDMQSMLRKEQGERSLA